MGLMDLCGPKGYFCGRIVSLWTETKLIQMKRLIYQGEGSSERVFKDREQVQEEGERRGSQPYRSWGNLEFAERVCGGLDARAGQQGLFQQTI